MLPHRFHIKMDALYSMYLCLSVQGGPLLFWLLLECLQLSIRVLRVQPSFQLAPRMFQHQLLATHSSRLRRRGNRRTRLLMNSPWDPSQQAASTVVADTSRRPRASAGKRKSPRADSDRVSSSLDAMNPIGS